MTVWLERLRPSDLQIMLPQVLLTLDQIRDQAMDPERRLAMLRALRDQVEAIQAALPFPQACPPPCGPTSGSPRPLTLEQRLARAWCSNLQRLLMELGQPRYEGNARFAVYREWTLRQLLRGLSQAVTCAVRSGQPGHCGLWRSVYDLFLYLEGRDELQETNGGGRYRFNPEAELKRLFLLGGIAASPEAGQILEALQIRLRDWVEASKLRRGESPLGELRSLRLDVAQDQPPQWGGQGIGGPYNGWLLDLPKSLSDLLDAVRPGTYQEAQGV